MSEAALTLYTELENDRLAGAQASHFAQHLRQADETAKSGDRSCTVYQFFLDEHRSEEGHPVLFVIVQDKFDEIVRCGVALPCW